MADETNQANQNQPKPEEEVAKTEPKPNPFADPVVSDKAEAGTDKPIAPSYVQRI